MMSALEWVESSIYLNDVGMMFMVTIIVILIL